MSASENDAPPFDNQMLDLMNSMRIQNRSKDPDAVAPQPLDQKIAAGRQRLSAMSLVTRKEIESRGCSSIEEQHIDGPRGVIPIVILRSKGESAVNSPLPRPCVLFLHHGAMVAGTPWTGLDVIEGWIVQLDAVAISVDYRLAPEHTGMAAVEDCYAALCWIQNQAMQLSVDMERLVIVGSSAGAGLAAATALMARDKGGPGLRGQLLDCAMLDDRNTSTSCQQYFSKGLYTGESNAFTWSCFLGGRVDGEDVSIYEAPSRANDLSHLPSAFISVSSSEPLRDENVAYASQLWKCGVQAELHVWPGGPHGFDFLWPNATMSQLSLSRKFDWIKRMLTP